MIDTHTHIYSKEFAADRDAVVARARRAGLSAIVLPNEDDTSLEALASMCDEYAGYCFPLYGLHPTELTADYRGQLERIFAFAEQRADAKGVGEIGLDLYWDKTKAAEQAEVFAWQIDYAIAHNLPMSIHCRNAYELLFQVFEQFSAAALRGSLHCFSGSAADAQRIVTDYPNMVLGVNGTVTYKNSELPAIYQDVPLQRIVLETDAPYLSPVPMRGKRNEPSYVPFVAQRLAEIYGLPVSEVEKITDQNARRVFGI